jgi:hypothetical protein
MDKPTKKRLATDTLSSKEDMEVELNRKLPKRGTGSWIPVPVQSEPLTEENVAPVEVQPTPAPTFDETSNYESQGNYPEGYDFGARYGGYQATRFNSTLVNDEEADARAEWNFHRHHPPAQTAGYVGAYLAPFPGPSARSQGFPASYDNLERESQASPALDRIERIMGCMERQQAAAASSSTVSTAQLHALIGQGKFLLFSLNYLKCLKFARSFVFLSIERRVLSLSLHLWKVFGAAAGSLVDGPIWYRLSQRLG